MRKLWLFLISVLLFTACSDEIPEPEIKQERTVLAYLVANNQAGDLGKYLRRNIVDMYAGLTSLDKPSTLLVYYRPSAYDPLLESLGNTPAPLNSPSVLKFVSDGKGHVNGKPVVKEVDRTAHSVVSQAEIFPYTEPNHIATDPFTMQKVFTDMKNLSPSDSYGLIMGSHASGWMFGNSVQSKAFGDDAGYSIDIPVLADVLETAFAGDDLEFVLFDACMMGAVEVCYELRDATDYVIGSALETPVDGFPYKNIISTLYQKNVDYQKVCDEFIEHNRISHTAGWGTCAAVDCSKVQQLADWVKKSLPKSQAYWDEDYYTKVQQYGVGSYHYFSFDVVDFFRQQTGEVPAELQAIINQVVIGKQCLSGSEYEFGGLTIDKERFCGIGMYFPYYLPSSMNRIGWTEYYEDAIDWYKAVEWNRFRK